MRPNWMANGSQGKKMTMTGAAGYARPVSSFQRPVSLHSIPPFQYSNLPSPITLPDAGNGGIDGMMEYWKGRNEQRNLKLDGGMDRRKERIDREKESAQRQVRPVSRARPLSRVPFLSPPFHHSNIPFFPYPMRGMMECWNIGRVGMNSETRNWTAAGSPQGTHRSQRKKKCAIYP
jgi:hypothetical protein